MPGVCYSIAKAYISVSWLSTPKEWTEGAGGWFENINPHHAVAMENYALASFLKASSFALLSC